MTASDDAARERALDPARSFIVQAPAGSGKTGLLTQRFLRLLSLVDAPEQVVAITFTLKAAAEMRRRILRALRQEEPGQDAREEHDQRTRKLALAAREHARERGWQLEEHPARLRIQSIDAFCLALASQSPLLSRAGASLIIAPDPDPLYVAAARRTLASIGERDAPTESLQALLRHRDNQAGPTERQLAQMLARRDQWLPLILELQGPELRARLETDLARELVVHLEELVRRWPARNLSVVSSIAHRAAPTPVEDNKLVAWRSTTGIPTARLEDLARWRALATWLLTKGEGTWRQRADNSITLKADREQFVLLTTELKRVDGLNDDLRRIGALPDPRLTTAQWQLTEAVIAVLKRAAQELEIEFRTAGKVDFTAVAGAALQALGNAEQPSELALSLDYRIHHLLVDEYQDTSVSQYRLLEKLTAEWVPGDGRTFFCVGDPMQSIYRFRQAEVGLFLRTRDQGLGALRPEFLQLDRNFRSQGALVTWFNTVFAYILPRSDDMRRGAVRHAVSRAVRAPREPAVTMHPLLDADLDREATLAVMKIRELLETNGDFTIGVLGRQRAHLSRIAALLTQQGVRFQAIEMELLASQSSVRDLTALSRALLHFGDRPAWLAILRSPVCGATLADLTALTAGARDFTTWELMNSEERLARLSPDGRRRLAHVRDVIAPMVAAEGRSTLRRRVEGAWLSLGGPAAARNARALEDAQAFLEKLDSLESEQPLPAGSGFGRLFAKLFARPDPEASSRLQLMTVHKAKGLEFDAVILAGVGRSRGDRERPLMNWMEVAQPRDPPGLLMAPIKRKGSDSDTLSAYVGSRVAESESYERARLLYVAATRARHELHLYGHVVLKTGKDGELQLGRPEKGSALELLWPSVGPVFAAALESHEPQALQQTLPLEAGSAIRRLVSDWALPQPAPAIAAIVASRVDEQPVRPEFDWATETTRHIGTVVHLELERWAMAGALPLPADIDRSRARIGRLLNASGVPSQMVAGAVDQVVAALRSTLTDTRGRWIFDEKHRDARSELALSGVVQGDLVSVKIDRTFVDEAGVRWIIDFKTSAHLGGDLDAFLDSEVIRYRPQLDRYAQLAARTGPQPVKRGLYFPLLKSWREW